MFALSLRLVLVERLNRAGAAVEADSIVVARQDSLANFASGMMILMYRPFDVGDIVDPGGVSGKVSHMSLVSTTFMTLDNKRLVVPNNLYRDATVLELASYGQHSHETCFKALPPGSLGFLVENDLLPILKPTPA